MTIALVIGGSDDVWAEFESAKALCTEAGKDFEVFFTNDMIALYPGTGYAVTLHPDKLAGWLARRRAAGFPVPKQVIAHRAHKLVQKNTTDWGGSVGLLATKAAMEAACMRIILCGVPLDTGAGHVVRKKPWPAAMAFRRGWEKRWTELKPKVRSMSGWTATNLGKPTVQWLTEQ
jgi:hypothetical protein